MTARGRCAQPAGASARREYRIRIRRRRRIRWAGGAAALAGAGTGTWLLVAAHLPGGTRLAAMSFGLAVACGLALAFPGFGGRDVERWQRGADGEGRTAEALDRLAGSRWSVRHDLRVPGSRANVDHVVVGRTGVWVIDTKTTRAGVRAGLLGVRFGDRRLDPAPVRWEAEVVADRLGEQLAGADRWGGADVRRLVRPVVAVHGTWSGRRRGRSGGVRVVPADDLVRRLRRHRRRLRRSEVADVVDALDRAFPCGGSSGRGKGSGKGPSLLRAGRADG